LYLFAHQHDFTLLGVLVSDESGVLFGIATTTGAFLVENVITAIQKHDEWQGQLVKLLLTLIKAMSQHEVESGDHVVHKFVLLLIVKVLNTILAFQERLNELLQLQ